MEEDGGSNIRVWRVRKDSPGGIAISSNQVIVQGDKNSFVSVEPGSIGLVSSKVVFQTQPENIFKGILFKENLDAFSIGGFKLGFWFAQQGSMYTFVILIFIYVRLINKLDKKYGFNSKN